MKFKYDRNTRPISWIYEEFGKGDMIIDDSYQRRKIWMPRDNVRLIETILHNLVIPEIFLWPAYIDSNTGKRVTHIVDGQQRIYAITDFISNEYKLKKSYLTIDETKDEYDGKYFNDLTPEQKEAIWEYKMPIVEIDKDCSIDDIKQMFFRLNLTEYSLNQQERRNSLENKFGDTAAQLSEEEFWDKIEIFKANDVKRMRDIQYCATIIILAREGITETNERKINEVYDELKEEYKESKRDLEKINNAIELLTAFINETTKSFFSRKSQTYSMFSLAFKIMDENITLEENIVDRFSEFIKVYTAFRNTNTTQGGTNTDVNKIITLIKKYKLASSEGLDKISNRVSRLSVLSSLLLDKEKPKIEAYNEVLSLFKENGEENL